MASGNLCVGTGAPLRRSAPPEPAPVSPCSAPAGPANFSGQREAEHEIGG